MTVSELRAKREELERLGKGSAPVVWASDSSGTLLEVRNCGTVRCYPDRSRLEHGEYRGEGQSPDRAEGSVEGVVIQ